MTPQTTSLPATAPAPRTARAIRNFIDGEFVDGVRGFDKIDPVDGSLIGQVHEAGAAEVDRAVAAARAALDGP